MSNKILIVLIIIIFSSCSTVNRVFTGAKNVESLTTLEERKEYYNDFINPFKGISQLRHYNHLDSLLLGFGKLAGTDLPFLVVYDSEEKNYYNLNCFEDISSDVQALNNLEFKSLVKADEKIISLKERFMRQTVEDSRFSRSFAPDKSKRYEVFYVGGLFLGNKVKKRVLPIIGLNNLKSIQIVEMSMSEEDYNNN